MSDKKFAKLCETVVVVTIIVTGLVLRLNGVNHWTTLGMFGIGAAWLGIKVPWGDIITKTRGGSNHV